MKWILILALYGSGKAIEHIPDFLDRESCAYALEESQKSLKRHTNGYGFAVAICVPDRKEVR